MHDTGIPDMVTRITHRQNIKAAVFSLMLGLFGPLTALIMMHYDGQGDWSNMGFLGWAGRFVALCCLTVSAPKVYRFFLKATGGQKVEALGATAAVEVAALLAVSNVVGLYAFTLQVIINTLVYSNSISMDQKAIHKVERAEHHLVDNVTQAWAHDVLTKGVPVVTKRHAKWASKVVSIKRKRAAAPKTRKTPSRKTART